eukprot:193739_1
MSNIFNSVLILACLLTISISQTDVSSFGIVTSNTADAGTSSIVKLTLSWNVKQYECIINQTIQPNTYYYCSLSVSPFARLITNSLSSNTYLMKIEIMRDNNNINITNDFIRIETIKVFDEDVNHYEIDSFCLPPQFAFTDAKGILLQSKSCTYFQQRYKYDNFAMSNTPNAALKIAYAKFLPNILNYKNEAHEGAIKPPMITTVGIKTLETLSDAGSSSGFTLKLRWDTEQYDMDTELTPYNPNTTYTYSFNSPTTTCYDSLDMSSNGIKISTFSLELSSTDIGDSVGIDSIIVKDESDSYYNIDFFCDSNTIENWQKYNDLGTNCMNKWTSYTKYDGLIYDGNIPFYFMWDDNVFSNVNTQQQSLVFKGVALSAQVTVFKDTLANASSTGWIFGGNYRDVVTAPNCPNGALDTCARIAGQSNMTRSFDISQYINIMIQYDWRLSSMPKGTGCSLYYAFDGGAFSSGKYRQSSGISHTTPYYNETYLVPDHITNGYTNLSILFYNNASLDTAYCWVDNFYLFGDYLIDYDNCSQVDDSLILYSTDISSSNYCPNSPCIPLVGSNDYAIKQYKNINGYSNLKLTLDTNSGYYLYIYYAYNNNTYSYLNRIGSPSFTSVPQMYTNRHIAIPAADACASILNIKLESYSSNYDNWVDNLKLWGNVKLWNNVLQTS